jgi:hypothetical protein
VSTQFAEGFDTGYARAVESRLEDVRGRLAPPEYYWAWQFKYDLRDATRGEQEAVRVLFLAQRLELVGFTERHVELVELVLGHESCAGRYARQGHPEFNYAEVPPTGTKGR